MPTATFARRSIVGLNRLLKKSDSCFDRLSTNGKSPTIASLPPFALSLSKDERRVFQQPVKQQSLVNQTLRGLEPPSCAEPGALAPDGGDRKGIRQGVPGMRSWSFPI